MEKKSKKRSQGLDGFEVRRRTMTVEEARARIARGEPMLNATRMLLAFMDEQARANAQARK